MLWKATALPNGMCQKTTTRALLNWTKVDYDRAKSEVFKKCISKPNGMRLCELCIIVKTMRPPQWRKYKIQPGLAKTKLLWWLGRFKLQVMASARENGLSLHLWMQAWCSGRSRLWRWPRTTTSRYSTGLSSCFNSFLPLLSRYYYTVMKPLPSLVFLSLRMPVPIGIKVATVIMHWLAIKGRRELECPTLISSCRKEGETARQQQKWESRGQLPPPAPSPGGEERILSEPVRRGIIAKDPPQKKPEAGAFGLRTKASPNWWITVSHDY